MLKRTLYFSNPVRLSLKDNQLVYYLKDVPDEKRTVPIEDIGYIVLENQMISVTMPLMNALTENNVAVVICNGSGMPNALLQPLDGNTVQGEMYRLQTEATLPLKKTLWKQCVEAKIKNQARLLNKLGLDNGSFKPLYMNVKSGDSDNREGVAAKIYWEKLFGKDFIREREGDAPNNLLNYGYTILRAAVARSLTGSGLLPSFGIFHRNRYNAFPLADDIMEAYRPFVDERVFNLYKNNKTDPTKELKAELIGVLYTDCKFDKVRRPLGIGLTLTAASLAKCFAGKEKRISFPLLE